LYAIDEKSYGSDHTAVAFDLNNLALLLDATDRRAEAEPMMRRMLVIFAKFKATTGREHPVFQEAVTNYRSLLMNFAHTQKQAAERVSSALAEGGLEEPKMDEGLEFVAPKLDVRTVLRSYWSLVMRRALTMFRWLRVFFFFCLSAALWGTLVMWLLRRCGH